MLLIALGIVLGNVSTDVIRWAWSHRGRGLCWYIGHRRVRRDGVCESCHHYIYMSGVDEPEEARWISTMWAQ